MGQSPQGLPATGTGIGKGAGNHQADFKYSIQIHRNLKVSCSSPSELGVLVMVSKITEAKVKPTAFWSL